jgi:hypothetical protein
MASIINATTSSGVAVSGDTSGVLQLATNGGTTAVTIDTSQNVGIGTTSPAERLRVQNTTGVNTTFTNNVDADLKINLTSGVSLVAPSTGTLALGTSNTERMRIDSAGTVGINTTGRPAGVGGGDNGKLWVKQTTTGNFGVSAIASATDSFISIGHNGTVATVGTSFGTTGSYTPLAFYTSDSERMRIDASGNVLVGTTGISTGTFKGIQCGINAAGTGNYLSQNPAGTSTRQWAFGHNNADQYVVYGYNNTTFNTGAYIAWGGTSWTASSDERLKDIIEPITDAVNKVSTLRTVIGKYKTDEEGTRRAFLIAQDVQKVLPEAVDAADPEKLGVSYTDVIPLLVASIKEQQALITTLQTQVAELKQKVGA